MCTWQHHEICSIKYQSIKTRENGPNPKSSFSFLTKQIRVFEIFLYNYNLLKIGFIELNQILHAASPSRRWTLVQWSESGSQVTRSKRRRRRKTKKMMSSLFTTLNWTSQYRRRCDYVFCDNVIICPKNVVNNCLTNIAGHSVFSHWIRKFAKLSPIFSSQKLASYTCQVLFTLLCNTFLCFAFSLSPTPLFT